MVVRIGRFPVYLTVLLVWLSAGLLYGAGSGDPQDNTGPGQTIVMEVIAVHHRPAAELLPAIQAALSPRGRTSVDKLSNSLLVFDTKEHLAAIRTLLKTLDRTTPQVTILLRYQRVPSAPHTLSTGSGITAGPGRTLSTGSTRAKGQMMLRVASGSSGYLRTGREVVFDEYWLDLCGRYGYRFSWFSRYRLVETGFEVQPVVLANQVDLTLVPKLSFDRERSLFFTETATRTTVPLDTWVTVALTDSAASAVAGALTEGGGLPAAGMVLEVKASVQRME